MLDEAVRLLAGDSADESVEPVRMDLPVDAFVPGDYVPYEAAKIEIHRRVAGAREVAQLIMLREELEDRFGPVPDPLDNLIRLQDARIKLGRAGARSVDFRGARPAAAGSAGAGMVMSVTPIELDSRRAKRIREEIPEALYESGKSQLSMRVSNDPAARFPAVVRAADVLLAVTREAA
jgi:transcription-repair coupling factor (superfamily II helicase)